MRPRPSGEAGFTLVEVVVAAGLLLVGLLATVTTIDVANRGTATADKRNSATAIARRVIEAGQSVTGDKLKTATLTATLQQAAPDLPSSGAAGWTVQRGGKTFTVATSVCTVDDPGDGTGVSGSRDSSFCSNPAATATPDAQPADYKQLTVTVSWTPAGRDASVTQVADVPIGAGTNLPLVTGLTMQSPFTCSTNCPAIVNQSTTSARFAATTANNPASITWLVQGNPQASCPPTSAACSGSVNSWTFNWDLGSVARDSAGTCFRGSYTYDGVFEVGARPQDANGLTSGTSSISVALNRCAPLSPGSLNATGRNANTPVVDVEWAANPEGDIVGYRVYEGTSTTNRTPTCPSSVSSGQVIPIDADTECVDPTPGGYAKNSAYYYGVYAVDRDPNGNLREGALAFVDVNTDNRAPNAPTSFGATRSGTSVALTWTLPATQDPDAGDSIASFRVYRVSGTTSGSPTYLNRYDRETVQALCTGSSCRYVDDAAGTTTRTYWVTAVDTHLRESAYTVARSL